VVTTGESKPSSGTAVQQPWPSGGTPFVMQYSNDSVFVAPFATRHCTATKLTVRLVMA
jgi:hypothetical protein